ncbi:LOW QUALITY PROTEIN: colipase-like protein 2 [Kogia breviceps]|uniref:LOW QUALITY PROTEIN: colipase-like protein 2 n=1 Tax=Kogia breviceps TaxID=27615 RepID=UPI00279530D8|nr:LOW QUALITY PROTEIN: colipase-like protein 2 [Kogia breviceps]
MSGTPPTLTYTRCQRAGDLGRVPTDERGSHHSECYSDCCLINLDHCGAFCVPTARITMMCLPQTKGAINIMCPCQVGLGCIHKDPVCTCRCHLI